MKHPSTLWWNISVVYLHDVLLERRDNVSSGRNNDIPSVRLHDVSNKSQMKHPTTTQWYVSKTSPCYVCTAYHVSITFPVSPKWKNQWCRCGTSPPRLQVMLWRGLVSRWPLRFQNTLSWPPTGTFPCLN